MNAIILCGGLSTRLGDITKTIPKILLEINGKTVLDWQLEKLKKLGVSEVVLAAGHLAEIIREQVGPERNGVKIVYSIEPKRLGTGGAIKFAWEKTADENTPVIILNGDILAAADLRNMVERLRPESGGLLLGARVADTSTYGTLIFDEHNRLSEFREKEGLAQPGYINGGMYLFNKKAKEYFPQTEEFSIEYDVFAKLNDLGAYLDVYLSDEPWVDIGLPERLKWARDNWQ
ncbi:MAG: sugar phosphate nucleotidyltransferase [Candidatus Magasanikbacteria bacterium]|nr:sugar phosphate nucleotidyltransferase [Candidatus Magasanikbacteria bacterium]